MADRYGQGYAAGRRAANKDKAQLLDHIQRISRERDALREALGINAQALAWLAFGECRGFDAPVATPDEAIEKARAALSQEQT